jgi:hypothetical protein
MSYLNEDDIAAINEAVAGMRESRAVEVALVSITTDPCPDCVFDPILNESTDLDCPTCGGSGVITSEESNTFEASILSDEIDIRYGPEGSGPKKRTLILDFSIRDYEANEDEFVFGTLVYCDDNVYRIVGIDFRGMGPEPNRVLTTVEEVD